MPFELFSVFVFRSGGVSTVPFELYLPKCIFLGVGVIWPKILKFVHEFIKVQMVLFVPPGGGAGGLFGQKPKGWHMSRFERF